MSTQRETIVLTGKVFWAHLQRPNELSGKYQIDLSIDDKTAEMLKARGVAVKTETKNVGTDKDRKTYVTLTQNATMKDGTKLNGPLVVDGKKNPIPNTVSIGNGSEINVKASIYEWTFKGKKGKSLNLGPIQIKTLVEYKNNALDVFKEEDFVYSSQEQSQDDGQAPWDKDLSF